MGRSIWHDSIPSGKSVSWISGQIFLLLLPPLRLTKPTPSTLSLNRSLGSWLKIGHISPPATLCWAVSPFSLFFRVRQTQSSFMCFRGRQPVCDHSSSNPSAPTHTAGQNPPDSLASQGCCCELTHQFERDSHSRCAGPVSLPHRNEGQNVLMCEWWVMEVVIWACTVQAARDLGARLQRDNCIFNKKKKLYPLQDWQTVNSSTPSKDTDNDDGSGFYDGQRSESLCPRISFYCLLESGSSAAANASGSLLAL